jgi:hypothetical protein
VKNHSLTVAASVQTGTGVTAEFFDGKLSDETTAQIIGACHRWK